MGLFGDLDLDQFDDDPWNIPDDTYEATVTESTVGPTKAGDKFGWMIKYTINSGAAVGQNVTEWKRIPQRNNPMDDDARAGAFLKQRLLSLGIPESKINEVTEDDLLGIDCYITTRKRGDNVNIQKVELKSSTDASSGDSLGL